MKTDELYIFPKYIRHKTPFWYFGNSILKMDKSTIPQINPNLHSMAMIIVLKIQKDQSTIAKLIH